MEKYLYQFNTEIMGNVMDEQLSNINEGKFFIEDLNLIDQEKPKAACLQGRLIKAIFPMIHLYKHASNI